MSFYLPPKNFSNDKVFNVEDYDFQFKPLTYHQGDDRYLLQDENGTINGSLTVNGNETINGEFAVNGDETIYGSLITIGDITSNTINGVPTNYYSNIRDDIQQQFDTISNVLSTSASYFSWVTVSNSATKVSSNALNNISSYYVPVNCKMVSIGFETTFAPSINNTGTLSIMLDDVFEIATIDILPISPRLIVFNEVNIDLVKGARLSIKTNSVVSATLGGGFNCLTVNFCVSSSGGSSVGVSLDYLQTYYLTANEISATYLTANEISSTYLTNSTFIDNLNYFYQKTEVDGLFYYYYTKTQMDNIITSGYYDKLYINGTVATINGNVASTNTNLSTNYYTKTEINTNFPNITTLSNYYTKTEIDTNFPNITTLSNYYTKTSIDSMLTTINGNVTTTSNNLLNNYYNKDTLDTAFGEIYLTYYNQTYIDNFASGVDSKFNSYVTKTAFDSSYNYLNTNISTINGKITNVSYDVWGNTNIAGNVIFNGNVSFTGFLPSSFIAPTLGNHLCNKTYIDTRFDDSATNLFVNYYNKSTIDTTFGNYFTTSQTNASFYTKLQVDGLIGNPLGTNYVTKTAFDNSYNTLDTKISTINGKITNISYDPILVDTNITGNVIFNGNVAFTDYLPSSSIIPTLDTHLCNKTYVDANVGQQGPQGPEGPQGPKGKDGDGAIAAAASAGAASGFAGIAAGWAGASATSAGASATSAGIASGAAGGAFARDSQRYAELASESASQAGTLVNTVQSSLNTINSLKTITGAIGAGFVAGTTSYLLYKSVQEKSTGNSYYIDNSYNIAFDISGDMTFPKDVAVVGNITNAGLINSTYYKDNFNPLLAGNTRIGNDTVNLKLDYYNNTPPYQGASISLNSGGAVNINAPIINFNGDIRFYNSFNPDRFLEINQFINQFMSVTSPDLLPNTSPDLSSNIFKKTNVYGKFTVQDRYSQYDTLGNPSGSILEVGSSDFYGNVTISKDLTVSGNISSSYLTNNFYTKTATDTSLNLIKTDLTNNYYTKTATDTSLNLIKTDLTNNYYTKTATDTSLTTINTNLTANYYTKTVIDASFADVYSKLPPSQGNFNGEVRVGGSLFIGANNVAGYDGVQNDYCNFQYVNATGVLNSNKTVLRINVNSDPLNSGQEDSINLNPSSGVGINTDFPQYKLDVAGGTINSTTASSLQNFRASNSINNNYVGISSYLTAGSRGGIVQNTDSALVYNGGQSTYGFCICPENVATRGMRFDSNGNIGIGKSNPSTLLDVNGTITCDSLVSNNTYNKNTIDAALTNYYLRNGGTSYFFASGALYLANSSLAQGTYLTWNQGGNGETNFINSKGGGYGGFNFWSNSSNTSNSGVNLMTLTTSGKLGIGTSSPLSSLHIHEATGNYGNANNGSITLSHDNTNGSNSIVFKSKSNAESDYGYIRYIDDFTYTGGERSRLVIGVENDAISSTVKDCIVLSSNNNNGHVGVNNFNPTCALDVTGNIKASSGITCTDLTVNGVLTANLVNMKYDSYQNMTDIAGGFAINGGVPIYMITNGSVRRGTGIFWNSSSANPNRTDFLNYSSGSGNGGFDFWVTNPNFPVETMPPTKVLSITKTGGVECPSVKTPIVTVNLVNLGSSQIFTGGTPALPFPLPETIFINNTDNLHMILPDVSGLPETASVKITVFMLYAAYTGTTYYAYFDISGGQNLIYDSNYVLSNSVQLSSKSMLILCKNKWYNPNL